MARIVLSTPHITRLGVEGFKSIKQRQSLEIRPLTIFAGTNSSGKSSIMQPLLLMKQTLEASYDPGPLLLNGPNVRFTLAKQLFSSGQGRGSEQRFLVEIGLDTGSSMIDRFEWQDSTGITISSTTYTTEETDTFTLAMAMSDQELVESVPWLRRAARVSGNGTLPAWVERFRCFLSIETEAALWEYVESTEYSFRRLVENAIHLPGLRGNPARTYPRTATDGPHFVGTFENYVASLVHRWQEAGIPRLTALAEGLRVLGLTDRVEARSIDDTSVELLVGRLPHSPRTTQPEIASIADVGLGVSQVLPVIVALIAADPGQLVYIEQPELHLHPRAQTALAQLLADAARRGVRVVVETHSSLLLLGVQTLVAEGELPPELVKLHWFRRDDEGMTEITSTDLDESGAFDADWPEDFAEVAMHAENRYLSAAEARQLHLRP